MTLLKGRSKKSFTKPFSQIYETEIGGTSEVVFDDIGEIVQVPMLQSILRP